MITGMNKSQLKGFALAIVCAVASLGCSGQKAPTLEEEKKQAVVEVCKKQLDRAKLDYSKFMSAQDFPAAYEALNGCATVLEDKGLLELVAAAEQREFIKTISNSQGSADVRATAIRLFEEKYPNAADENRNVINKAQAEVALVFEKERKKRDAEIAVARKTRHAEEAIKHRQVTTSSDGVCSDAEYRIYQRYDEYLESNPSIPDNQLRSVFSRKVGMQPNELKNLYTRCAMRWAEQSPAERNTFLKKEFEIFAKDCARRPSNDPYCKSVLSR